MPGANLACATIYGAAMVMVGRLRINAARPGEKYFARTTVVRRRVAGARSKRVGDSASIAHVGAKNISPLHPWCGGVWRARHHNVWTIARQSRTPGRKIFRPYTFGAWLNLAGATIWGAAMFDGWVTGHRWRT